MRISCNKGDPGYCNYDETVRTEVFLDGKLLSDCITADDAEGTVVVYKRNQFGGIVVRHGNAMTERRHGKVEIRISQRKP